MTRPLIDFYRCPAEVADLAVEGGLSSEEAYFRFGDDVVCYGCSSTAAAKNAGWTDLSKNVSVAGATVVLPFDLSEIIDNLRRERYAIRGRVGKQAVLSSGFVQKLYYSLRPALGIPVRRHLQRVFLRNWDRLPFPAWPVDTSVETLLERVLCLCMKAQGHKSIPFIWFWPEGASCAAMVTHDVETRRGMDFVPPLMDIDEAFGIKSSFQVVPEGSYRPAKDVLSTIRRRGFEVGIQDLSHDGNLFDDRRKFQVRARSINRYISAYGALGFRSGRMYRNVDWYDALDVSYDMSVPNVAHLDPQRGGCCTVFPYFVGQILELPLTTCQDYSLFHVLGDYSLYLWKKQIDLVRAKSGLVSFLVHPDYIREGKALDIYKSLLRQLCELRERDDVWIARPQDVNCWWRQRSQMKLVRNGSTYRIEGAGKARARLAYARIEGDRLVCNVEQQRDCGHCQDAERAAEEAG